jgi:hypothetical protein
MAPSHDTGSMWFMLAIGYGFIWDRMRQLGESVEYRMGRAEREIFSYLKCNSPRLCQLRTNRLAPVNKIDVLEHT